MCLYGTSLQIKTLLFTCIHEQGGGGEETWGGWFGDNMKCGLVWVWLRGARKCRVYNM